MPFRHVACPASRRSHRVPKDGDIRWRFTVATRLPTSVPQLPVHPLSGPSEGAGGLWDVKAMLTRH